MSETSKKLQEPIDLLEAFAKQAASEDEQAFEALYRGMVDRIHALCLRLAANDDLAHELTQRTFIQVWRRLDSYRGEGLTTWMHRIALREFLGERRSESRRASRVTFVDPVEIDEVRDEEASGFEIDLQKALLKLPDQQRAVFVMHDVEGHEQVAEVLGIAQGTSKSQLFRARRRLQEILQR